MRLRNSCNARKQSARHQGDFDITAQFAQFGTELAENGSNLLMLLVFFDNDSSDEAALVKRRNVMANGERRGLHCNRVTVKNGAARRDYFASRADESTAGRLRLARRGDQMYYLYAENDSEHFQLIGQTSVPTENIQADGIRLITQVHRTGTTRVIWQSLHIRAESLSGRAIE